MKNSPVFTTDGEIFLVKSLEAILIKTALDVIKGEERFESQ